MRAVWILLMYNIAFYWNTQMDSDGNSKYQYKAPKVNWVKLLWLKVSEALQIDFYQHTFSLQNLRLLIPSYIFSDSFGGKMHIMLVIMLITVHVIWGGHPITRGIFSRLFSKWRTFLEADFCKRYWPLHGWRERKWPSDIYGQTSVDSWWVIGSKTEIRQKMNLSKTLSLTS